MRTITNKEAQETHNKLRDILIKSGNEEYGDCIIDDICWLFGFPTTNDVEDEEEETVPITYGLIKATVGWSRFCDVTGKNHYAINEFGDYPMNEVFDIPLSQAKTLEFI